MQGTKVSLMARGDTHLCRKEAAPALSFVPNSNNEITEMVIHIISVGEQSDYMWHT